MNNTQIIFSLLRNAISGTAIDAETVAETTKKADDIYRLSKYHDVAHLVSFAVEKNKIPLPETELTKKMKKRHPIAMLRYEATNRMFLRVCEGFEQAGIPFVPLKGSVIRKYYPEPWMRTSCDIDILIHEEDLDRAVTLLQEKYSYNGDKQRDFHDVSLFSQDGTHLELHFNILENMKDVDSVLADVWQYAKPSKEGSFMYELENEFLIYHILAHMSYHVLNGGCGIRPFIDLYLLEHNLEYDEEKLCDLCARGGLLSFKTESEKLADVWMREKQHDSITKTYEKLILGGGVYGSLEASSAVKHMTTGGKGKYILTRIFQPYNILKEKYPVLKKHKWLVPVYQVNRWFHILTSDKKKLAPGILKAGRSVSKEQVAERIEFLKNIGLAEK